MGRSQNNAAFLAALLRQERLLVPALEAETQHVRSGDWDAWKKTMFAEAGKLIEIGFKETDRKPLENELVLAHKEHKKTLSLPHKK